MTVQVESPTIEYIGNGATGPYAFSFRANVFSDIDAYLDGVQQPSNTYSVDLNADQDVSPGGNVFFNAPISAPTVITIRRTTELDQQTDYRPYDPFPAESHEDAIDKLTMISQDQQLDIDRSLKASVNDDGTTDYTLPPYDAGKALAWDDVTKSLANSDDKINGIITAAKDSEDAAAISASNAATSEVNAATSETNAATSETNAATSETNALASETNAATSETNAATSETNAATSETNALASENKANLWAEEAEDIPVEPGEFSAFHWAQKSKNLATGGDAIDIVFDDANTFVKGINVQVFNEAIDNAVESNRVLSQGSVQISGSEMLGDLRITKPQPNLELNTSDTVGSCFLLFKKQNITRAIISFDGFDNALSIGNYNGGGALISQIFFTSDGKIDISVGDFQISGQNIEDRYLRKDIDDVMTANLTIKKSIAEFSIDADLDTNSLFYFKENGENQAVIHHQASANEFVISKYLNGSAGATITSQIKLTDNGKVNVSVGDLQVAGKDIKVSTVIALGEYFDGVMQWTNNISVFSDTLGIYLCTFDTPEPDTQYAIFIQAIQNLPPVIRDVFYTVNGKGTDDFVIEAYDSTGVLVAGDRFYVKVERL